MIHKVWFCVASVALVLALTGTSGAQDLPSTDVPHPDAAFSLPSSALEAGSPASSLAEALAAPGPAAASDDALSAVDALAGSPAGAATSKGDRAEGALSYANPSDALSGAPLQLSAHLTEGTEALDLGVDWHVFAADKAPDGTRRLVATSHQARPIMHLPPGEYLVHAAFGWGGATKRVVLSESGGDASLVLGAGGLMLAAEIAGKPLSSDVVAFDVLRDDETGRRVTVARGLQTPDLLRLNAGMYHVVSRYGEINAVVRADIEVRAGKITELTVAHRAAAVTLKLVAALGGEALANTRWTVLNEGGDKLHQSIGAFPRLILAEGTYTAVARHKGRSFAREFRVTAGADGEVEVRTSDLLPAAN